MSSLAGQHIILHTDGGSRGNPGPAGAGWVAFSQEGKRLLDGHAFLGTRTNNEAEYEAVIRGLTAVVESGATHVTVRADSELLVKQLNGEYRVKNLRLKPLVEQVRDLAACLHDIAFEHVRREHNKEADAMANRAMDSGGSD